MASGMAHNVSGMAHNVSIGMDILSEAVNHTESHDRSKVYAVVGILSVFAVTGTIGNALAFYVFYNLKNKLTSTIFILALAGVDFITCLVTIPYTIAVEYVEFYVKYDAACKFYHFLITTTIPFSAFIMVAIAVDRYLCICHPFLHLMTIKRARIIVGCLSAFALALGATACVHYSVFKIQDVGQHVNSTSSPVSVEFTARSGSNVTGPEYGLLQPTDSSKGNFSISRGLEHRDRNFTDFPEPHEMKPLEVYTGQCVTRSTTIDPIFFMVYQRLYSGFFLVCCVVVFILYSLIYKSVISQRQKRLRIKTQKCCLMWDAANVDNEQSEVTVALELNHSTTNGESLKTRPDESLVPENNAQNSNQANSSRARLERMRMANIKTAMMLFVVTLVFIIAFSPAWLMVHHLITMDVVFFYMYFIYNVVNPIIYAFMNNAFRVELRKIFHCE
ncbi:uncharacterized protein LOC124273510 [Haliotis rubra]|uniref:uncharacterized protein LOC124273510 n=1 Tax=Haliotis rubra TaxID=36100 RepID=UPI001EE6365C|nr:uncharacterized protein LOC124273510 [Haliotis rubra]XP_046564732.1 uncharacterized protein LOC124273510 [Haliotis rubra]XP_046564733.1 uncharacterized protein LOC124273510 [Haliotis rubra]XP_046564734.1 uncharacterized protein LOC124273510 [Haliotis rubra]XP_046564735.1 uncharacterized protein LOC124273510 [Haliotis rubra]XP_046564736.1 uncharacterized protein LOC124273510 [Haliotis rubra]XP_046564738.1 uncharacterized protein LOC124273510 [Haliotis rubra]